jgi:hypothetical protein
MCRCCRLAALFLGVLIADSAPTETIAGKVVQDDSGAPLASVEVRLSRAGSAGLVADLETDTAGQFRAADLPPAEYRVEVSKPNYVDTVLSVREPGATTLLIRLVRRGVISGQVTDAQAQPVRGATVFAMVKTAGEPFRPFTHQFAQVDEHGQYRLYNLPPGRYAIAVSYGASTMAVGSHGSTTIIPNVGSGLHFYLDSTRPQFFTIAGGEQIRGVDFVIAPAALYSVSGRVELPVPDAEFWLALTSPEQPALAVAVAIAERDGKFRFEGIPPGSYYLFVSGPAIGRGNGAMLGPEPFFGRTQVDVGGQNVENISVTVQKGRSAAFVLRAPPSQQDCRSTAVLTLFPLEDWGAMLERSVEVNSSKPTIVDNLAPARYHVAVTQPGEACHTVADRVVDLSGDAASGPIEIGMASAGAIHGRLNGNAAHPSDFAIVLVAADGDDAKAPVQIAFPDAESRFHFERLRPGRYRIAAQPAEDKSRWSADQMFEIDVPGGAPTEIEVPVPPAKKSP